jgi:hypothetical protein
LANALLATFGAEQLANAPAVPRQREGDPGARQRRRLEHLGHVSGLGPRRAQELSPRGHVEEQVRHLDARARAKPGRTDGGRGSRLDADLGARLHVVLARLELEPAHGRDTRQRLTAEAVRDDALEVGETRELARGVSLESARGVLRVHPDAVVGHHDARDAATLDLEVAARRLGVERVLDELLHHARRPLDHLARRDLARKLGR